MGEICGFLIVVFFFFFNDTATTEIYTLSLHDALPIFRRVMVPRQQLKAFGDAVIPRLSSMKVGNPRNPEAKMGPVVNKAQQSACLEGLSKLKEECEVLFGDDK